MKKQSLSTKLIVGGVLVVLIPVLVIGLIAVSRASRSLQSVSEGNAITLAEDLAKMTQLALEEEIKMAEQLSVTGYVISAAEKVSQAGIPEASDELSDLEAMLMRILDKSGDAYEGIILMDKSGVIICDGSGGKMEGTDLGARAYFQSAKQGRSNVSNAVKSKLSGNVIVPVCAPVHSSSGNFIGAVALITNIDFISSRIVSSVMGETGHTFMVDSETTVVAHSDEQYILNAALSDNTEMQSLTDKVLTGKVGVIHYSFDGVEKIAGIAPVALTGHPDHQ
jgi:methyl-accepting chemotaxis protein